MGSSVTAGRRPGQGWIRRYPILFPGWSALVRDRWDHCNTAHSFFRICSDKELRFVTVHPFIESLGVVFPAACGVDKVNYPSDTPLLAAGSFIFGDKKGLPRKAFFVVTG